MQIKRKQSGLSLMELLVVITMMVILMGVSIPAAKKIMESFERTTGVRQLINAALSNARTIAIRQQTYAGVRFQRDANGNTYMVFIVHDMDKTELANGFLALKGRMPMKLPEDSKAGGWFPTDTSPFTIIFSPAGKLTIHAVRTCNQDGKNSTTSVDTIFNTQAKYDLGQAMFVQDAGNILSVNSFYLDSKEEFINPYTGELVIEYIEKQN